MSRRLAKVPSATAPADTAIAALNDAATGRERRASESELERLKKRVRELAAELVAASEAARLHLARELHDGVGPELTAARFALASLEPSRPGAGIAGAGDLSDREERSASSSGLKLAQRSLDAATQAARRLVADLHEPRLDGGLVNTLSEWTLDFAERTGLHTTFVAAADVRLARLPQAAALAVFRVAQEALSNVAKHAGARRADVRIESDAHDLTLIVADDGKGMPRRRRRAANAPTAGFGVPGMMARCEAFGGSLRVLARGTRARANAAIEQSMTLESTAVKETTDSGTIVRARFAWDALLGDAVVAQPAAATAPGSAVTVAPATEAASALLTRASPEVANPASPPSRSTSAR